MNYQYSNNGYINMHKFLFGIY